MHVNMRMSLFSQRRSIRRLQLMQQAVNWKLKEDVIMTDTGSTKGPIMEAARQLT